MSQVLCGRGQKYTCEEVSRPPVPRISQSPSHPRLNPYPVPLPGDLVPIIERSSASWWLGKTPSGVGYFPATHGKVFNCPTAKLPTVLPEYFVKEVAVVDEPAQTRATAVPPAPFSVEQFKDTPIAERKDLFVNELLNTKKAEAEYVGAWTQRESGSAQMYYCLQRKLLERAIRPTD